MLLCRPLAGLASRFTISLKLTFLSTFVGPPRAWTPVYMDRSSCLHKYPYFHTADMATKYKASVHDSCPTQAYHLTCRATVPCNIGWQQAIACLKTAVSSPLAAAHSSRACWNCSNDIRLLTCMHPPYCTLSKQCEIHMHRSIMRNAYLVTALGEAQIHSCQMQLSIHDTGLFHELGKRLTVHPYIFRSQIGRTPFSKQSK